jgi:hypothetical protein
MKVVKVFFKKFLVGSKLSIIDFTYIGLFYFWSKTNPSSKRRVFLLWTLTENDVPTFSKFWKFLVKYFYDFFTYIIMLYNLVSVKIKEN